MSLSRPRSARESASGLFFKINSVLRDIQWRLVQKKRILFWYGYCWKGDSFDLGWNYWGDIRDYCKKTGVQITKICVDLNFSVFDYLGQESLLHNWLLLNFISLI